MKKFVQKNITAKRVLFVFLLTNLVYFWMLFVSIPKVMLYSNGLKIFDLMPLGYSKDYAVQLLYTLGIEGRNIYLFQQIPLDMIYPFLFGVNYCLLIGFFLNKLQQISKPFFYLTLLPLFGGLFDYLENMGIISMLISFPDISFFQINFSTISTILKSIFSTLSFSVLGILMIIFAIEWMRKRKLR